MAPDAILSKPFQYHKMLNRPLTSLFQVRFAALIWVSLFFKAIRAMIVVDFSIISPVLDWGVKLPNGSTERPKHWGRLFRLCGQHSYPFFCMARKGYRSASTTMIKRRSLFGTWRQQMASIMVGVCGSLRMLRFVTVCYTSQSLEI